tara:strand:+ start:866 stop:988 length:123 start_codon:yes stop_codon:yes gene_type:complete
MLLNKKMKEAVTNPGFEETSKIRVEIINLQASDLEIVLSP